jgi:hypothetical protein
MNMINLRPRRQVSDQYGNFSVQVSDFFVNPAWVISVEPLPPNPQLCGVRYSQGSESAYVVCDLPLVTILNLLQGV